MLADPESRRRGAGEQNRVVLEVDERAEAYALYRLTVSFEHGGATGTTTVGEALAITPEAMRAVWRFLLDVD